MMRYLVGFDIGTYESKGCLCDETLNVVASAVRPHGLDNPVPGYFEHDADAVWWRDVSLLSRELLAISGINPADAAAIGCSALGADCLPVGEDCQPLRPAILYGIDSRAMEQCAQLTRHFGADQIQNWFGRPLCSSDIIPKILWIQQNEPEISKRTWKFLTASSFLAAKLTGNYTIDRFLALSSFNPLFNTDGRVNEALCSGICRPDQLAEVRETTDLAGYLTAEASKVTGLSEGTPVIVGGDDAGAEAIAAGLTQTGDMMIMFGSSLYMILITDRLVNDDRLWREQFIIPGSFDISAGTNSAGTLTRWYRDRVFPELVVEEHASGTSAYAALANRSAMVPAGCDGLVTLPYWAGERTPINDPDARGVIFGLTLKHTREHLYRSALEGVAFAIRQHFEIIAEHGLPINRITAIGGGVQNKPWMQIVSDITGHPIITTAVKLGASFGDAMMAGIGCGMFSGFSALAEFIHPDTIYMPNPDAKSIYERNYRAYTALYDRTSDLMRYSEYSRSTELLDI